MGPIEALKLALSKEIEAMDLYNRLSAEAPAAKEIFLFLVGEEQKHKRLIEQKISEMTK
jgi:rubrerythrin